MSILKVLTQIPLCRCRLCKDVSVRLDDRLMACTVCCTPVSVYCYQCRAYTKVVVSARGIAHCAVCGDDMSGKDIPLVDRFVDFLKLGWTGAGLRFGVLVLIGLVSLSFFGSSRVYAATVASQTVSTSTYASGSYPRMPIEYLGTGLTGQIPTSVNVWIDSAGISGGSSETKVTQSYSDASSFACQGGSGGCSGVFLIACPPGMSGCTTASSTNNVGQTGVISGGSYGGRWVYGWVGVLSTTTNTGFANGRGAALTTYTFPTSVTYHTSATTTATTTMSNVPSDYLWFLAPWTNLSGTPYWRGSSNANDYVSGFCLNTNGTDRCSTTKDLYFSLTDSATGSTTTPPGVQGSTGGSYITVNTPTDLAVVATTTLVGATGSYSADDYLENQHAFLKLTFVNNTYVNCLAAYNSQLFPNLNCAGFGNIASPAEIDLSTSTSLVGAFNLTATTTFNYGGIWVMTASIVQDTTPWWYFGLYHTYNTVVSKSSTFTVGAPTSVDIAINHLVASSTAPGGYVPAGTRPSAFSGIIASTTAQIGSLCNPLGSNFSMGDCLLDMIYDQSTIGNDITVLEQTPPWGYPYRFYSILVSSTTGSIPVISAVIPPGIPGTGAKITLDVNHALDYILNATTSTFTNVSASSTQTFYEITSVYWGYIVYAALGLYILSRILGGNLITKVAMKFK